MYSADTELDPRVDTAFARKLGARSVVCVPLKRGTEPIGVLCLVSTKPSAFSEELIAVLKNLNG